jgi:tyrosyl-tRNA synthetase
MGLSERSRTRRETKKEERRAKAFSDPCGKSLHIGNLLLGQALLSQADVQGILFGQQRLIGAFSAVS